jgi:hypothetical protein
VYDGALSCGLGISDAVFPAHAASLLLPLHRLHGSPLFTDLSGWQQDQY